MESLIFSSYNLIDAIGEFEDKKAIEPLEFFLRNVSNPSEFEDQVNNLLEKLKNI
ncbi:MAG: hypothetical protein GOP50_07405 [Candidatus Heimdallarchaeota archaeon]|nr:hypothetical protein [Candidatus Heimdallarchaeota archaeon]